MLNKIADELNAQLEERLEIISHTEWESWVRHPCGDALKLLLQAEQAKAFEDWVNSGQDEDDEVHKLTIRFAEYLAIEIFKTGLHRGVPPTDEDDSSLRT